MKKCLILNGPPGSGKDTIAALLEAQEGFTRCENKGALFDIALAMSGIDREVWFQRYNDRALKEQPWAELNGMSQREFLIYISETCVKPALGDDQFGKLAARAALKANGAVVFSDGGFQPEMKCLQEAFGKENVYLCHLYREGCSFDGDSRNYLKPEGSHYTAHFVVEGEPERAVRQLIAFLEKG